MAYWLMKSEPGVYSFDDLQRDGETHWEGVRNYQARNLLRDKIAVGDQVFFYHSSCAVPGIVGVASVSRAGYPDHTAFDKKARYYDAESDPEHPRWYMVDVRPVRALRRVIGLAELKAHDGLADCPLIRRGNRLSVMPLTAQQWQLILALE